MKRFLLLTTCVVGANVVGAGLAAQDAFAQAALSQSPSQATEGTTLPPSADTAGKPADTPWKPPANFGEWASGIKLSFQAEAGIIVNTNSPRSGTNFGQLLTDKSNRPILNQLLATAARDIDPKATSWDFGFKFQLMYGSDARITHSLGVFDQTIHDRNQLDVVEANLSVRIPLLQGIDVKAGIYPTPLGVETIDPKGNAFYSKSYIFNYGIPLKHMGVLATAHVTPVLDLYGGIDSGVNTTVGGGDNNDRPGGIFGFGLNLLDGKLTVLALSHIGPENPTRSTPFGNSAMRYLNDVAITYKATDKLTFVTELNYARDDGFRAEAWGVSQYVAYALTDTLTLNGRGEIYRDNNNFFVSNPASNRDFANFQRGRYSTFITAPSPTTYGEVTLGVTYKPSGLPPAISNLQIRPEVRYDSSLNNTRPFNDGKSRGVFTLGTDFVLTF